MIEAKNLVKWYGPVLAVDDVSFHIPHGQIVGFLGPNGAGKSTTLRMLTGYLPPTGGTITVDGLDALTKPQAVRSRIGYLPENTPLYPEMRVEEYLHYRGRLQRMDRPTRVKRIDVVCQRCGLAGIRRRPIGQLSRGNRQRVGLAQALLHDPPVLVLDEPTAGLDPNQITHVRQLIRELRGRHTILLSTHILPEVEKAADRVLVIASGKIVADGTPDALRRSAVSGSNILIEVKALEAEVASAFANHRGVQHVATSSCGPWCRAVVTPKDGSDVREALGQLSFSRGWPVREICHESSSLEQFFVRITAEQDRAAVGEAV